MALFKELVDLFITFFKIGIVTFGGGLTMLPLLERVLINEKNWVSMDEILDYLVSLDFEITTGISKFFNNENEKLETIEKEQTKDNSNNQEINQNGEEVSSIES